jgi:hypothetical protein
MHRWRKSQLGIAIIAGIALLLMASFFLYSATSVTKSKTSNEAKQVHTTQQEMKQVTAYVQSCLDSTLKRGLEILGKQGGYVGDNYNMPYPKLSSFGAQGTTHLFVDNYEVRYGILRNTLQPPLYPTVRTPYGPSTTGAPPSSGERNFPSLEVGEHSLHNHLKTYVMSNINNCLDFSIFSDAGLTVSAGDMKGELTIGATNIIFALNYSLEITNILTNEQITQSRFSSTQDIRLGSMHSLMASLITEDVNDITFDMSSYPMPDGIILEVRQDVYGQDDLIILKDSQSILNGKPYELRVGRQNRNPALHHLLGRPGTATETDGTITTTADDGTPIDLNFIKTVVDMDSNDDGIDDHPRADDPDEDPITSSSFSYIASSGISDVDITSGGSVTLSDANSPLEVKVKVTDGALEDYQSIIINKNP